MSLPLMVETFRGSFSRKHSEQVHLLAVEFNYCMSEEITMPKSCTFGASEFGREIYLRQKLIVSCNS